MFHFFGSLTDYYKLLPINNHVLSNQKNFTYWLYEIHNKVNDKLREQQLIKYENPSYVEISQKYKLGNPCTIKKCWNFLYSIAMNYPEERKNVQISLKYKYYIIFFLIF